MTGSEISAVDGGAIRLLLMALTSTLLTGCVTTMDHRTVLPEIWSESLNAETWSSPRATDKCQRLSGVYKFDSKSLGPTEIHRSFKPVRVFADLFEASVGEKADHQTIVQLIITDEPQETEFRVFQANGFPISLETSASPLISTDCKGGALFIDYRRSGVRVNGKRQYPQTHEAEIRRATDGSLIVRYELYYREFPNWGFSIRHIKERNFYRFEQATVQR